MSDEHDGKRQWFEEYIARIFSGVLEPPKKGVTYVCPCCGYPTLSERGAYDICCLCNWEDDGQDDPHADEVWGGPNGRYSLTEARRNFLTYWIKYRPDDDSRRASFGDSEVTLQAKQAMVQAFNAMRDADASEQARLWKLVRDSRATLRRELRRRIREYEQWLKEKRAAEAAD